MRCTAERVRNERDNLQIKPSRDLCFNRSAVQQSLTVDAGRIASSHGNPCGVMPGVDPSPFERSAQKSATNPNGKTTARKTAVNGKQVRQRWRIREPIVRLCKKSQKTWATADFVADYRGQLSRIEKINSKLPVGINDLPRSLETSSFAWTRRSSWVNWGNQRSERTRSFFRALSQYWRSGCRRTAFQTCCRPRVFPGA